LIKLFPSKEEFESNMRACRGRSLYEGTNKEKNREVNVPMPRAYFFFAGAFFASFLTGFLAT
jgi:hypothetical protein